MPQAWTGTAIFTTVTNRDRFHHLLKDKMDAVEGIYEYDQHSVYAPGIVVQNNLGGTYITGPAMLWCLVVPDDYANDPPEGNGWVTEFENDILALNPDPENPTVAETETALGGA